MDESKLFKIKHRQNRIHLVWSLQAVKKCTVKINICEDIVNRKESICYLGLTMDENLSFKNHISNINKKASYNLFMMGKICRYLSINTAQQIGLALVISNMDYCNGVFYGSQNSVLQPLQITQNRCAKMILYKDKYSSSTDARYTLHWLPIKDRILYTILCLAFKCIHGLGSSYLNEMFVQNVPQRRLR